MSVLAVLALLSGCTETEENSKPSALEPQTPATQEEVSETAAAVEPELVSLTGEINYLRLYFNEGTLMAGALPYFTPAFDENGNRSVGVSGSVEEVVLDLIQVSRTVDVGIAVQIASDGNRSKGAFITVPRAKTEAVWVDSDRIVYPAPIDLAIGGAKSYDSAVEAGWPIHSG